MPPLLVTWFGLQRERSLVRAANIAVLQARVDEVGHTLEAMYGGYQAAASRAARDRAIVAFCARSPAMRRNSLPSIEDRLDVFRGEGPAIRGLTVLDPAGNVIAAAERPLLGKNLGERPEFQSALIGVEATSDVFISSAETDRTPSVNFAAPVRTAAGLVVGVYLLSVRAEALTAVMRAANDTAGRGSFFALFDQYGIRAAHGKNPKLLFHPSVPLSDEAKRAMLASRRFQERTAELINAVIPFPFQEIQGDERKVFWRPTSPTNNVANLAASRRFPTLRGTIVAHVPQSEVEVTVLSVLPRVLPGFAVGLALAIAGCVLLIRLRRNKDVLEKTFEYMDQGISIASDDLKVIAVNRRFGELLGFPEALCKPGTSLEEFIRYNVQSGEYGPGALHERMLGSGASTPPPGASLRARAAGRNHRRRPRIPGPGDWCRQRLHRRDEARPRRASSSRERRPLPQPDRAVFGLVLGAGREPALHQPLRRGPGQVWLHGQELARQGPLGVARHHAGVRLLGRAPGDHGRPQDIPRLRVPPHQRGRSGAPHQRQRHAHRARRRRLPRLPRYRARHHREEAVGGAGQRAGGLRGRQALEDAAGRGGEPPLARGIPDEERVPFTPPDGSVVVRARAKGADAFLVEVEDSGVGIKPEDLRRLFIEFQQLDAGYTKKYGGTGLGLAFTKRLVEAQGGSVGVRSTPGQGSVFHAILPRRPVGAQGPKEISV